MWKQTDVQRLALSTPSFHNCIYWLSVYETLRHVAAVQIRSMTRFIYRLVFKKNMQVLHVFPFSLYLMVMLTVNIRIKWPQCLRNIHVTILTFKTRLNKSTDELTLCIVQEVNIGILCRKFWFHNQINVHTSVSFRTIGFNTFLEALLSLQ